MAETRFDEWIASRYARLWPTLHDPAVLDPAVDLLADLAGSGPVLEFGIGTGRVAVPLSRRGVRVCGIELSSAMAEQIDHGHAGQVEVTIGDLATTSLGECFTLVYLLRNTITNLTTQAEQVDAFCNAAAHLRPGGCFLVENYIPGLQRLPPGETTRVFVSTPDHIGFEEYDLTAQLAVSHHRWVIDGGARLWSESEQRGAVSRSCSDPSQGVNRIGTADHAGALVFRSGSWSGQHGAGRRGSQRRAPARGRIHRLAVTAARSPRATGAS